LIGARQDSPAKLPCCLRRPHASSATISCSLGVGASLNPEAAKSIHPHTSEDARPSCAPAWRHGQGQALPVLRNLDPAGRDRTIDASAPREMSLVSPREIPEAQSSERTQQQIRLPTPVAPPWRDRLTSRRRNIWRLLFLRRRVLPSSKINRLDTRLTKFEEDEIDKRLQLEVRVSHIEKHLGIEKKISA
jgi:hypothetical protein